MTSPSFRELEKAQAELEKRFPKGQRVRYVPDHGGSGELGTVRRCATEWVFVVFDVGGKEITDEGATAKACLPRNLTKFEAK